MNLSIDFTPVALDRELVKALDLPKIAMQQMLETRTRIIADTTAGHSADGGTFRPYSLQYKTMIDSGKLFGKSPGNHTVNFTVRQILLRSMTAKAVDGGAEMTFTGDHPPPKFVTDKTASSKRHKAGFRKGQINAAKELGGGGHSGGRGARGGAHIPKGGKTPRLGKGGGGSSGMPNAELAKILTFDFGRPGWFAFSEVDKVNYENKVHAAMTAFLSKFVVVE